MTTFKSSDVLRPYLNPLYWNGHSIGYGEATRKWPPLPISGREHRQAKRALQNRIALIEKAIPIETYKDGQCFNVETYELGTLVIFREESLSGRADSLDVDVEDLVDQPLPTRPFDVSPSFGRTSTSEQIRGREISYFTAAKWGVISAGKDRNKLLRTVSTGLVDKIGGDKVLVMEARLGTRKGPIEVGKTDHFVSENGAEKLRRINALDVVAHGEPEKQKVKFGSLASRLAFGGRTD